MARQTVTVIRLQGRLGDTVHVNSKAYGYHTRAVRGSGKPALLNDSLQAQAGRTALINRQAKNVHDQLKMLAGYFKEKMLWQELLKRMRRAGEPVPFTLLQSLEGMEINSRYPLSRIVRITGLQVLIEKPGMMQVQVAGWQMAKNSREGLQWRLVLLFFDRDGNVLPVSGEVSGIVNTGVKTNNIGGDIAIAAGACYWLCCLQVQELKHGQPLGTLASQGMKLLRAGELAVAARE